MRNKSRSTLLDILLSPDLDQKVSLAKDLDSGLDFESFFDELNLKKTPNKVYQPGRPEGFKVIDPKDVPLRRNIQDPVQKIHFLHAIANIELLAIELPILALLRFGSTDLDILKSQIKIIQEEAHHFELLSERLEALGSYFGALPVHHGLWDYALRCDSDLEHQILIPCYLEARGLDVCPSFIQKFKVIQDQESAAILDLILKEEIGHVQFGIDYLNLQAKRLDKTPDELFKTCLESKIGVGLKSKIPLDIECRKKAGFTPEMLQIIRN